MGFVIIVIIVVVILILNSYFTDKARKERIYQKYGHTETAENIINKTIWIGETASQLLDSFGRPLDIDEKVLKTKRKEIWKYYQKSATRYGLKITVENNIIIGWDEKL